MSDIENKQVNEKATHGDFKHDSCVIVSFNNKLKLKINKFDCEIRIEILRMNMGGSTVSGDFGRSGFSIYPHSPALEINKFSFHFSLKYPKFNIPCSFRFDSNEQRDQYIALLNEQLDLFCSDEYFWESHKEKNLKQAKNLVISTNLTNEFNETMKMQNSIRELEKEIKRLETHNKETSEHSDYIIKENTEIRALNQELVRSKEQIIKRNNELANENNIYNQKNFELSLKYLALEESHKILDETIQKLEIEYEKEAKELNDLTKINSNLEHTIRDLRDIISHGTAENKSLIEKNGDLTDNSYKLFNENVELKKAVEVLNERNNNQHNTIKKLDREIFGLESAKAYHMDNTKEEATNILYKKSTEIFGNKHIFEQTIEEMAELMVEINKVRRVNEGFDLTKINNLPQIMEEVCDVQMCLNHLKILFNETDFKNIQVKKFNKFTDHFKRQFSKKQNEDKLSDLNKITHQVNDLISNPETKNHVFIPLDINEDQLFAESVNGCP